MNIFCIFKCRSSVFFTLSGDGAPREFSTCLAHIHDARKAPYYNALQPALESSRIPGLSV